MGLPQIESIEDIHMKLERLQVGLLSGEFDVVDVSDIMQKQIRPKMLKYIGLGMDNKYNLFSEDDKQNVFLMIFLCQYIFNYSGLPTGLSDLEYDQLYEVYINLGNDDMISVNIPKSSTKTANHHYPSLRGTLTKVYYLTDDEVRKNPTRKYLNEWIKRTEKIYSDITGRSINLNEEDIYVFPKWDGCSCVFEFNPDGSLHKALTRGNVYTNVAQDITRAFPHVIGKKTKNGYGLKTEIMMRENDLDSYNKKYNTTYRNTRSIVSSILNTIDSKTDPRLDMLVIQGLRTSELDGKEETLQELADMAFDSPYIKCKLKDVDKIRDFAENHRYVDGLRCDGAVIYLINKDLRKILGREDNKNRYEVAYKFTEETALTKLTDVVFQLGPSGKLNPVAIVKPVKLKGNTITRISLGSMARFDDLNLRYGDTVKVNYDIIPYLIFDLSCKHNPKGDKIKTPKKCPYCGEPLELENGIPIRCANEKCAWKKKGKILNYFTKLGIEGIGFETVDQLYEAGICKSIKDIYKLHKHKNELIKLEGFGEISYKNLIKSINDRGSVYDYEVLGALGIEGISTETFKVLLKKHSLKKLMLIASDESVDELCEIPGIKKKKATKIIDGLNKNIDLIDYLLSHLDIKHDDRKEGRFRVVFTKVRDSDLESWIRDHDGTVENDVKKVTDILIVPEIMTTSTKTQQASKYGIPMVSIDHAKEYIIAHFS